MGGSAKVTIHATYPHLQPLLDCQEPVICTFSLADGRGSAVLSARKVTGYIPLCSKLCGMKYDSVAPCEAILQFRHNADVK